MWSHTLSQVRSLENIVAEGGAREGTRLEEGVRKALRKALRKAFAERLRCQARRMRKVRANEKEGL